MSTMQRLTLIGLYNYDNSLFDNVILPDGYNKQTFIDTLLLEHGEKCVLYSDFDFMKYSLGVISRKWNHELKRIYEALSAEYNPIWNYDRNEEFEDVTERTSGGSTTTEQLENGTTENRVSAFNSSSYEPNEETITDAGKVKSSMDSGENGTINHTAHLWGNIGVTTSAAMVLEETKLRAERNMYDVAGRIFANELLIQIY